MRIKKGDIVTVIAGKDKGKEGEVLRVIPSRDMLLIKGIAIATKHVKKTAEKSGERIEKEMPIHVSNVMIKDGDGNPSRVRYSFLKDGKKVREFTTTGKEISENFTK